MSIFEPLKRAGVLRGNMLHARTFARLPFSRLIDLCDEFCGEAVSIPTTAPMSPYIYSAPSRIGCDELVCRLKSLDELARFSALYSDKVYIFNPLAKTASMLGNQPEHDSIEFRLELWDNLTVLVHARRLIEAQLIVPFTPRAHLCPSCLAKAVFGEGTRFRSMQKDLEARLKRRLGVQVGIDGDDLVIELDGSHLGVDDHEPGIFVINPVPEFIVNDKELYAAMKEGRTATYPNKTLNKLRPHIFYSYRILEDIVYQMAVAYSVGSRFLTQGGLHAEALLSMAGDRRRRQINRALLARLAIQLPIAADVPIKKLVELRDREQDAFVRFRAALNQVADAVRGEAERDLPRFAPDIYDDIVRPRLAELNERVSAAKRDLVTTTLANAGGAMGVLCLGFFSGVLSAEMTQVLQSLGLAAVVYKTVTDSVPLMDVRKSIRQDELYYLWKVIQLR